MLFIELCIGDILFVFKTAVNDPGGFDDAISLEFWKAHRIHWNIYLFCF